MIETKALAPSTRGGRQVVEFLDFGKEMSTCGLALAARAFEQLGQAVQGLRAEHHVHVGRALDDFVALLAGHAAADANQHAFFLQVLARGPGRRTPFPALFRAPSRC